jgi:hypothetical protein
LHLRQNCNDLAVDTVAMTALSGEGNRLTKRWTPHEEKRTGEHPELLAVMDDGFWR